MKELDPKAFSEKEKRAFDLADMEEWKLWLANGSVAIVPANEESKISRDLSFTAPMRFVRTNRSKLLGQLRAKSRLIIPGNRDPQLVLERTYAPTTSPLAVMVVATLAASRGWY